MEGSFLVAVGDRALSYPVAVERDFEFGSF